ncbi:YadA-like family protein [Citrobacter amalonaticus]|uniref:YadA-like family protein n=1 Tax=Citrobacter amalonaticus TaxID=35703 RepID=UPI00300CCEF0
MKRSIIALFVISFASLANAAPATYDQTWGDSVDSQITDNRVENHALAAQVAANQQDTARELQTTNDYVAQVQQQSNDHDIQQDNRLTVLESQPAPKDGKDGIDGKDGRNGIDGAQGAKGDTGATGAQGVAGSAGRDGLDGKNGLDGVTTTITRSTVDTQTRQQFKDFETQTNKRFSDLSKTVNENKKQASAGTSAAMAMASIPGVAGDQRVAIGAGVGGYDGENALSVGASVRLASRVQVKAAVSSDSASNFGYGAGVSIGW